MQQRKGAGEKGARPLRFAGRQSLDVLSRRRSGGPRRLAIELIEALESRMLLSANVLNYHNDDASSGVNNNEVELTPSNVKVGSFGKLFTVPVDGQVYAQPLIDSNVTINNGVNTTAGAAGVHNVAFVATENDTLYAIDASVAGGAILWKRSFLSANSGGNQNNTLGASSISIVTSGDVGTQDINPTIGITGTPVIDATNNLLYVSVATKEVIGGVTYFVQRLHAINLSDGTDVVTPYLIGTTTNGNTNNTQIYCYGTGDGAVTDPYNGTGKKVVQFNALRESQRTALSLVNNTVYVSWASHGDNGPYHGWVVAWDVSALSISGLQLKGVFNTCPNDGEAGVWGGGGQLVFEPDDSAFYFLTGNGTGGAPTVGANGLPTDANYNEALVKAVMDPTTTPQMQGPNGWGIKATDFFIPYNVSALDGADSDFGSGAPILLPPSAGIPGHPNLMVVGGKDGRLFLIDRDNLGQYHSTSDDVVNAVSNGSGDVTAPYALPGLLSSPAYYNGKLYVVSGYSGAAYAFTISSAGQLVSSSQTNIQLGYEPGGPSISANDNTNGIVWVADRNLNEIHAYDANTMATELWNTAQASGGAGNPGALVKFAVPTVANGELYVGTTDALVVYGLTPPASSAPQPPVLLATPLSGSSINLTWSDPSTPPNLATGYLIEESTDGTHFSQITTAPAGATSIAIGGLSANTPYYFRIRGFNAISDSGYSNISSATSGSGTIAISYPSGFASAASTMTLNGSAVINGSALELTNGNEYQAGSAFANTAVTDASFNTQFNFQLTSGNSTADGFTFALQNNLPTAVGGSGEDLGYEGIPNSIAIKFDLYNNSGEGVDSTGLYTGGALPTNVGSVDLSSTGINFHNGDPFQVNVQYTGTTLTVVIQDTVTNASATQNYTINIPSVIGNTTAYAGFTGGTGGIAATQNILNWTYSTTAATSPNTPLGLGATPASATSVNLNWTAPSSNNQTGYYLDRSTSSDFTQNLITETLPATPAMFTDTATGLAPGETFYYRIRAFDSAGPSGNSNTATVPIPLAPAKPTNQMITNVTSTEIDISWQDNAGNTAEGYEILGAVNFGAFSIVATLPPTSRTAPSEYDWSATNLTPGDYYEYHIEAYNVSGNNDFAGVNATTLTLPPSNVQAMAAIGAVNLSWAAPTGAVSYNIYRGTSSGAEAATPIAAGITITTWSDTTVTNGTPYFYEVTAVNGNTAYTPPLPSESAASSEVTATPRAGVSSTPSAPVLAAATDSGASNSDGITNFNNSSPATALQFAVGGTVAGATVGIYANSTLIGSAVATGTTTTVTTNGAHTLAAGSQSITAAQTVSGGSISQSSPATILTIDTTAPTAVATLPGVTAAGGTSYTFTVVYSDAGSGVNAATFTNGDVVVSDTLLSFSQNAKFVSATPSGNGAALTATYSITPPGGSWSTADNGSYSVALAASQVADVAGNFIPAGSLGSISVAISAAPTGALSGNQAVAAAGYNLTTLGTSDWAHWGRGGTYGNFDHKATGGSQISNVTVVGTGANSGGYSSTLRSVTWTDGTPTGSITNDHGYIWSNGALNTGFSFTVPADTTTRTLTIYTGGINVATSVTAQLSDGSAAPVVLTGGQAGTFNNVYTITYSAASAGQTLKITLLKTGNLNGRSDGSVDLIAAALAGPLAKPAAPTGFTDTAGNTQATLSWGTVAGATSYNVYRSSSPGGEGTTPYKTGLTVPTFTDTGLTNNTPYYYKITAVNGAGEGPQSAEQSITPIASVGKLSGAAAVASTSTYNLSTLGTSDWVHWGRGGTYGNFDHKATGGSKISNVTVVGTGAVSGGWSNTARSISFTGGTPTASDSNDHGYIWSNGALNTGFSFTVPASTTTSTLTIIAGGYATAATLTAHLSDGSAPDYVVTESSTGLYTYVYTITFAAASAGQTLKITLLKTANIVGTNGSADLDAAYLS